MFPPDERHADELDAPRRIDPEIRALYPDKDDDWLEEAQESLRRYAEAIHRQYERIRNDPEALAKLRRLIDEETNEPNDPAINH